MARYQPLTAGQVSAEPGLDDWRVLLRSLQASFRTGSMAKGLELAAAIAAAADEADHHPDLTITYPRVHVVLTTHDAGGLTDQDVEVARQISQIASERGAAADPAALTQVEIAVDAMDIPRVKRFWEAVLGYRPDRDDDSRDPFGRGPSLWFQQMDEPRPQRNRIHVDVTVPHDVAQQRIEAALAAGGTLLSDAEAPAFWVLADPEGNEACICTWQGRP